jgi:hypothetical protein
MARQPYCHLRVGRTKKASSEPPNKSSKRLFSLLLLLLRVVLWILVLVISNLFPKIEGLAKGLDDLIQLLLANLDKD